MDQKKNILGFELGSTRIKAVLIDEKHIPVASGSYEWENKLVDGIWTYSLDAVHTGVQECIKDLKADFAKTFGEPLTAFGAVGVSAMMHGYLPFDKDGKQLAEFRTWRNTITGQAAEKLTALFGFNIPQRWSIAHLYQAMLNGEKHVGDIDYLTTLAGYIHYRMTGERCVGVGEASGIFPIDSASADYNDAMVAKFDALVKDMGYKWTLRGILPKSVRAGDYAGKLTREGALFLDPTGELADGITGIPAAPAEGDAGTGMAATNSVRVGTGNVSAGTSAFAMIVTDHELGVHREIDMVTTPSGHPVAMVHCNNCTSDINSWVGLFAELLAAAGKDIDKGELYTLLFKKALEGDADCGGLLSFNYLSGEGVTDIDEGRPVFMRLPDSKVTLANFMRTQLLSALATLKIGLDILTGAEKVRIDKLYGHGGFFKTPGVGQRLLSAAVSAPVSVMSTAGEGGPYGMALLGAYMLRKADGQTLEDYLDNVVFAGAKVTEAMATEDDIKGFAAFLERYKAALPVETAAVAALK